MTTIRALLAAIAAAIALTVPAAAAYAAVQPAAPTPGAACATGQLGQTTTIQTSNGPQQYRCEQRQGDPCPVWHWVYNPDVPKGQKTPTLCPTCPTAPPASPPASSAPVASASPTAPPATLPVTGSPTPWLLALAGGLAVIAGVAIVLLARYRRRTPARRRVPLIW